MTTLSEKERESVAIGAAIGAGCRPCTRYHVNAALKAGLSEEEIRVAVTEAQALRVEAATSVADYARGLLGDGQRQAEEHSDPGERSLVLVQIGAATGGNAGHLLDRLLPAARGLGLSNDALKEAVEVAGMVKKAAGDFFRKDADRALGREGEVAAATAEGGGCAEPEPVVAAAGEGAQRSPGSCC